MIGMNGVARRPKSRRRRLALLLVGMLLDVVDFSSPATLGPFGALLGGALVYWYAGAHGLRGRRRWWPTIAAAIYCATPFTAPVPLGTLVGGWLAVTSPDAPEEAPPATGDTDTA